MTEARIKSNLIENLLFIWFRDYSEVLIDSKNLENALSLMVKKYISMIFFTIIGANIRYLTLKTSFSAFIFSQAQIGPKNSKKFTELHFFTINDYAFFQDFWSQCAPQKNLWTKWKVVFWLHLTLFSLHPLLAINSGL